MKNEEKSVNQLDSYFAKAREMQPVVGIEQIENQIRNSEVLPKATPSFKNKFNLKFKIVMSTFIIVMAAYITSLFLNNGNTVSIETKSVKKIEKQVSTVQKVIPMNDKKSKVNSGNFGLLKNANKPLVLIEPPVLSGPSASSDAIFDFHNPTIQLNPIIIPPKLPLASSHRNDTTAKSGKPFDLPENPLELDKKHLEALGFMVSTRGIVYERGIIYTTQVEGLGSIWYSNNKNGSDLKINSNDIPVSKTRDYYPVYISETRDGEPMNIDSIFGKQSKFEATDTSAYWKLIPVLIKQSDYHGFEGKQDLIFWFKLTPSFSEVIKDVHSGVSVVLMAKPGKSIPEEVLTGKPDERVSSELKGLKTLELNKSQMERLGFIFGIDSLQYKCTITGHGTIQYFNTHNHFGLKTTAPLVFTGKGKDIYPVFISDINGIQELRYKFNNWEDKDKWTSGYFLSAIRALVPVRLKQSEQGYADKKDLIFWFKVTPDFLAALPDSISKDMTSEYNALKESGKTNIDTIVPATCKYFDVCQLPLEKEYGIKIYPNPAKDKINLEFWPPKNDGTVYCTTELTDLNGKVLEKSDFHWYGRTAEYPVKDLKPGIYLIVYKLNTGEVITNKVMVAR